MSPAAAGVQQNCVWRLGIHRGRSVSTRTFRRESDHRMKASAEFMEGLVESVMVPDFWNLEPGVVEKLGDKVNSVVETPGRVRQRNCIVQPLRLSLGSNLEKFVVVKAIRLNRSDFRDETHFLRTRKSYTVETAFYQKFSRAVRSMGAKIGECVLVRWNDDFTDGLLVMEDLRGEPSASLCGMTGRSVDQKLALNMDQAMASLEWLAQFHASFWGLNDLGGASLLDLWSIGSYWSLEKRQSDLAKVETEWHKIIANFSDLFPREFSDQEISKLGPRLREWATSVDKELQSAPSNMTLLHGDFKTANIFLNNGTPSACDFQWVGPGMGAKDVAYLLWSSIDPEVVASNEHLLLNFYYDTLMGLLRKKNICEPSFSKEEFLRYIDLAFVDYVRFLVSSMWGSTTPETCAGKQTSINQGMHKRHPKHMVAMIVKASLVLSKIEKLPGRGVSVSRSATQGSKLVLSLLALCVSLSEKAGAAIREILTSSKGNMQAKEKDDDSPQTLADLESERLIVSYLLHHYPDLSVIGEEGISEVQTSMSVKDNEPDESLYKLISSALNSTSWDDVELADLTVWVDPLDGTKELLDGNKEAVTILIGIAWNGSPIAGVVHQPFFACESRIGRTWWGGKNCGLICDRQKHNLTENSLRKCIVATTRSHPSQIVQEAAMRLHPDEILPIGGVGNKIVMLLEGNISHYVFPKKGTKRWDTCAPQAVLESLGGKLVNIHGQEYDYRASCDPNNADGVVATLTQSGWERLCESFPW